MRQGPVVLSAAQTPSTAVSIFSGAGGLDLGAASAGLEVIVATDSMAEAGATYTSLLPNVEFRVNDIRKLKSLPRADVLLGGYPCQPFSMGGPRRPSGDHRSGLYEEFARCLEMVRPKYFVAENVPGLHNLARRELLEAHLARFAGVGEGYAVSFGLLKAERYGAPQRRRRLFVVGVRRDLECVYQFPEATHSLVGGPGTKPFASHGDALSGLPEWPDGEFYARPDDPEGHWSWYYMSRNRKARWDAPSYTILANARHTPIHPGSPMMRRVWSELSDGFKQGWEFSDEYEHLDGYPDRMVLPKPRRLSWRECALLQTFPDGFEPAGNLMRKIELIGNAVPPLLAEVVIRGLVDGSALVAERPVAGRGELWQPPDVKQSTAAIRRRIMQGNRSKNTKPEVALRSALHKRGLRFFKHHRIRLSKRWVTVDIVFPGPRVAVFVDGCFWHGCPEHGRQPAVNGDYWQPKLERNKARDTAVTAELEQLGWTVLRVWEHEPIAAASDRIEQVHAVRTASLSNIAAAGRAQPTCRRCAESGANADSSNRLTFTHEGYSHSLELCGRHAKEPLSDFLKRAASQDGDEVRIRSG